MVAKFDDIAGLDNRIAPYVKVLMDHGVETFEACEGGSGHSSPDPYIRFHGERPEGFRAFSIAQEHGLPTLYLFREWVIQDGNPDWRYMAVSVSP